MTDKDRQTLIVPTPRGTLKTMPSNAELLANVSQGRKELPQSWGRGIVNDIRQTVGTHWVEEMTNFNQKTVAVTFLVFISVISPTLTFGAVYGKATDNQIGAIETIMATAWVGVVYSLIGGMPLCVIGSTGPVLAFSTAAYDLSKNLDVPFLTFNAWISVWLFAYTLIAGFFDLTRFVKLATRFTDEIFALLIVSIFVMDAIGDPFSDVGLLHYMNPDHASHTVLEEEDPNYAYISSGLLSVILGLGTTSVIFFFRGFRHSAFFCNDGIRTSIHDFSVTLSVLAWTLVKELIFDHVDTESLSVPDKFEPTFACCDSSCRTFFPDDCEDQAEAAGTRSWLVDFGDLNGKPYVIFVAAGPALLAFLLCYLDNGITWHLIQHKSHNLKHGEAYNYDLCLNGFFNFVNGAFGLPWLVATTVPCIIHLNALAEKDRDGNFLEVQETRLTLFFSHLMLGLSILVLNLLKLLPLPVLYGVFLFMGLSSLGGIQFWNRIMLFFQQPSKYPKTIYTEHMEKSRIHMYTILQILFFSLVFTVQNVRAAALIFPMMTMLCIPGRLFVLPRFLEEWELLLLDGEDEPIEEWKQAKERSVFMYEESKRMSMMEESDSASGDVDDVNAEQHA